MFRFVHCTLSLVVVTKYLVRICEAMGIYLGSRFEKIQSIIAKKTWWQVHRALGHNVLIGR